jgi:hypothetical protein
MRNRLLAVGVALCVLVWLAAGVVAGQNNTVPTSQMSKTDKVWKMPHTPWSDPDLEGIWTNIAEITVPIQRPADLKGKDLLTEGEIQERIKRSLEDLETAGGTGAQPTNWTERTSGNSPRTSMIVDPTDGRIPPLTPLGQKRAELRENARRGHGPFDSWEDLGMWQRCITRGLPGSILPIGYNANYQILQAAGYVTIVYEMIHDARIIPLNGGPLLDRSVRQWMGSSRGHWEGNTLVVEVTQFNNSATYMGADSETFKLIERFTRVNTDTIDYRVTIEDPKTWTKPWTIASVLTKAKDAPYILEYACHEGNYAMRNTLSGARFKEKQAKEGKR